MANATRLTQILEAVYDSVNGVLKTGLTLNGDIEIGAAEIKDGTTDQRAKVATTNAGIAESDPALGVQAAVLGATADAAVVTSAAGTVSAKLRGLIQLWLAGLAAGEAHIGSVGGGIKQLTAEFTRPGDATPYTANDAVNNSTSAPTALQFTTAGRVVGGTGYIVGAEITHEVVSVTPRLRLYLFNTSPTLNNDNAGYAPTYSVLSLAGFLGVIDLDPMTSLGLTDASRAQNFSIRIPYYCTGASQIIYALVQTLDAFTPGNAKKVMVKLVFDQN